MYAIQNKRTGKFVFGTDRRYPGNHQRTSYEQALTFDDRWVAEFEFKIRKCGKGYRIVKVELTVLEVVE